MLGAGTWAYSILGPATQFQHTEQWELALKLAGQREEVLLGSGAPAARAWLWTRLVTRAQF